MLDDPLIDWLQQYGEDREYIPKSELSDYNPIWISRSSYSKKVENLKKASFAYFINNMKSSPSPKITIKSAISKRPKKHSKQCATARRSFTRPFYGTPKILTMAPQTSSSAATSSKISSQIPPSDGSRSRPQLFKLALHSRRHQVHNPPIQRRSDRTHQLRQHQSLQSPTLHLQPHARTSPRAPTPRVVSPRPGMAIHETRRRNLPLP